MLHLVVPAGIHKMNVIYFCDNDCAIRALVHITGMSYAKVHQSLSCSSYYQERIGVYVQHIFAYLKQQGITTRNIPLSKDIRLKSFVNKNIKGTFLALAKEHVYTIINGVVCGTGQEYPNQRLRKIWRVYPSKELSDTEISYINNLHYV